MGGIDAAGGRAELAAVEPPEIPAEAVERYDEALADYVEVAKVVLVASEDTGDERPALIDQVPVLGGRLMRRGPLPSPKCTATGRAWA